MSNTIKLKRGSGSNPSASDLSVGELAIRTDTGTIFTKKDDNSVAELSGGGISDGDKGDITVSNGGATFTIDNDAVTSSKILNNTIVNADINSSAGISFSKMSALSANTIVGRRVSNGVPQELTASQVRTILNVEDGATADQTASEIVALVADQTIAPSAIDMEDSEEIKLGTGDDLKLFHNGSHSRIINTTGNLTVNNSLLNISNSNLLNTFLSWRTTSFAFLILYKINTPIHGRIIQ